MGDILIMAVGVVVSAVALAYQKPPLDNTSNDSTWRILVSGLVGGVVTLLMKTVRDWGVEKAKQDLTEAVLTADLDQAIHDLDVELGKMVNGAAETHLRGKRNYR